MNRRLTHAALAAATIALAGCESMTRTPQTKPTVKMSVLKPSLTPLPETKPSQDKGGVEISIAPVTYTVVERAEVTDRTLYERTKREYEFGTGRVFETPVRVIERKTTPLLRTDPEKLKFQVKVVNKLPRVFRGQGMVVQFNVGGKLHSVDPSAYAELVQMIVPPRNEQAVYIYGPPTQELPASCPVGLFFYDVVTQIDNAGVVTEKQNFEWYYNYTTQLEEREGTTSTERLEQTIGPQVRVK
jgi:hypothetical protein